MINLKIVVESAEMIPIITKTIFDNAWAQHIIKDTIIGLYSDQDPDHEITKYELTFITKALLFKEIEHELNTRFGKVIHLIYAEPVIYIQDDAAMNLKKHLKSV